MPSIIKKPPVIMAIITLVIILFCALLLQQRSGKKLFRLFVLDPIPDSVTILHRQDEVWEDLFPGSPVWLHFKMSPSDFELILKSKDWKQSPEYPKVSDETENTYIASWWKPELFSSGACKYSVSIEYDNHLRHETIWVNSQKNEAYYRVTFIH